MDQPITLGPFALDDIIGRGGMGEVWGGHHTISGLEVAVKVLSSDRIADAKERDALAGEVQAMASLLHPGIIAILDYGHIPEQSSLTSGSPYIVMERAGQTLTKFGKDVGSWREAIRPLIEILEALAHAHSRGLVHRDLKPHNVLLVVRDEGLRWALTDFGLATPVSELLIADERRRSGTPRYMSPEQVLGDVREQGPWTDLYGFGCLATWLLTGSPPFSGKDSTAIMRKHISAELEPFRWRFAVPEGTEDWLRLLLAKDPLDRYRHAADALHGLRSLGAASGEADGIAGWADAISEVSDTDATLLDSVDPTRTALSGELDLTPGRSVSDSFSPQMSFADEEWAKLRRSRREVVEIARPGLPSDWRGREHEPVSMDVVGASLGLWGIRQVPLVGRERERDQLWSALRHVHLGDGLQVIVVRGGAGTGKSRLIEWFAQAATACGGANVLRARHSDTAGPLDGLDGMLKRQLRVVGATPAEVRQRVQYAMSEDGRGRSFDAFDVATMSSIVAPEVAGDAAVNSAEQRTNVIVDYLERNTRERPLLLWIDDVQWGAEAQAVIDRLLASPRGKSLLVVATLRDDLADRSWEPWFERVAGRDEVVDLEIAPLPAEAQHELVTQMLRLSEEAAERVVSRTEGNPLFAVQLVGHWVREGHLVAGEGGFELAADEVALPESIRTLWSERLAQFFHRTDTAESRTALQIAAALGADVDFREWTAACRAFGLVTDYAPLVRELVSAGLARMEDGGWSFAHGLLRETILADGDASNASVHEACAQALHSLYANNTSFAERIGRHWLAAGSLARAFDFIYAAAEFEARRGQFLDALELDEVLEAAMDAARWDINDPRRVHANLRRARTMLLLGEIDEAAEFVSHALDVTKEMRGRLRGEALWTRSIELRHRSRAREGLDVARRALEEFQADRYAIGVARAHQKVGEFSRRLGEFETSLESYRAAREIFAKEDAVFELGWVALGICATLRQLGQDEEAVDLALEAKAIFERIGLGVGLGNVHNELGEIHRYSGEFDIAEGHYHRVTEVWAKAGHVESPIVKLNLAMSLVGQRKWDEARDRLFQIIEEAGSEVGRGLRVYAYACMTSIAAHTGTPSPAEAIQLYEDAHAEAPLVDIDLGTQLTLALEACDAPEVRARIAEQAREQWAKLGRDEEAARVEALLAASVE